MKTVLIHGALISRRTLYCVSQRTGCFGDGRQISGSRAIVTIAPNGMLLKWEVSSGGKRKTGAMAFFLTTHADMSAQVATLLSDLLPRQQCRPQAPLCAFDFSCLYYVEVFVNYVWRTYDISLSPIKEQSTVEIKAHDFLFKFITEGVRVSCKGGSAVVLFPPQCVLCKTTGAVFGEGTNDLLSKLTKVAESLLDLAKPALPQ